MKEKRRASTAGITTALLRREQFLGMVYEPVRADEGICEAVHANGNPLFMTSIGLLDYDRRDITNIISEPLPADAATYSRKAVDLVTHKVAFLLPLEFLADAKDLFPELPLTRVYVLSHGLSYRSTRMAWYVFVKGNLEPPIIRWLEGP